MPLMPFARTTILDWLFRGDTSYTPTSDHIIRLHDDDPGPEGNDNEIADSGYDEAEYDGGWNAPAPHENPDGTVIANTQTISFGTADGSFTVSHVSIWDDASPPNPLYAGPLSAPVPFAQGNAIEFPAGNLVIGLEGVLDSEGDG